jgi:hypothetical protein
MIRKEIHNCEISLLKKTLTKIEYNTSPGMLC